LQTPEQQQQQVSNMTDGSLLSLLTGQMQVDDYLSEARNMFGDYSIPHVSNGLESGQGQDQSGSENGNENGNGNKRLRSERCY
jgi:hypothetical protein